MYNIFHISVTTELTCNVAFFVIKLDSKILYSTSGNFRGLASMLYTCVARSLNTLKKTPIALQASVVVVFNGTTLSFDAVRAFREEIKEDIKIKVKMLSFWQTLAFRKQTSKGVSHTGTLKKHWISKGNKSSERLRRFRTRLISFWYSGHRSAAC